jgi:hypothetical protein
MIYSITSSARASSEVRHGEAERLGGVEIDDQFEPGRNPVDTWKMFVDTLSGIRAKAKPHKIDKKAEAAPLSAALLVSLHAYRLL